MEKKRIICLLTAFLMSFLTIIYADNIPSDSDLGKTPLREDNKGWIGGKVIWDRHDLRNASVKVFKDPKLREIYTEGLILDRDGIYALEIDDPGKYYLYVYVDDNKNGKPDKGDGMGIYGVSDWSDVNQKPMPVEVKKGKTLLGMDIEITAVINEYNQVVPVSSPNLTDLRTGISGKLILPDYKFKNAIVYAYSDPLWNNKIAQTHASENGEYVLEVPAGKYYIMAIIDENNSNLMDAGDKFGVWGMTRFGASPRPVVVSANNIRTDRNIIIIGKIDAFGKPVSLQSIDEQLDIKQAESINLSGKVEWIGHDTKNALIQVYVDPSMAVAIARTKADDQGNFNLSLPPGEYYLTAGVDADGNGKYTKGDGIGIYGTMDAVNEPPQKLLITKDSSKEQISLFITAEFDDSGQLFHIIQDDIPEVEDKDEEQAIQIDTESPFTGISGKIIWTDHKLQNVMLIFAEEPSFADGIQVPLNLNEDGFYGCSAAPGSHFLMAIADNNANGQADAGDGLGFYGTGFLGDHWGTPYTVTVIENMTTPYINITITAVLDSEGKPTMTRDGVRAFYGEPNNTFDTEENKIEWWYWAKGVAFTFTKTDDEYILTDVYQFEPKEMQSSFSRHSKGIIYYSLEDNIWSVNPDGTNRNRIAPGRNITGTIDGEKLLFFDSETGLIMFAPYSKAVTNLNWDQTGSQQAMSNDGRKVAFVRSKSGRKGIALLNIETGVEITIPGENLDFSSPTWSPNSELIAYSASPYLPQNQQSNTNRDIYYYDLVSGRTEKVSDTTQDEFDPAWSPSDSFTIAFCRSEGNYSQIWLATFDANGKPSERQLTRHGGRSPAWSPNGEKIIYENNAQLWTINADGTGEAPILINNEPIFGHDPFWTR